MYKIFIVEDDIGIAAGIKNLAAKWEVEGKSQLASFIIYNTYLPI